MQDYLLKPISAPILVAAIDQAKMKRDSGIFNLRLWLRDKLLINKHDTAIIVDVNDILYR